MEERFRLLGALGPSSPVTVRVVATTTGAATLEVGVDPGWLTDAARVFPVRLDPYVENISRTSSEECTPGAFSPYRACDTFGGGANETCPTTENPPSTWARQACREEGEPSGYGDRIRTFLQFRMDNYQGSGDELLIARLDLWQFVGNGGPVGAGTLPFTLFGLAGDGVHSTTTWNNQPRIDALPADDPPTQAVTLVPVQDGLTTFNPTATVRRWLKSAPPGAGHPDEKAPYGFALLAGDGSGSSAARKYPYSDNAAERNSQYFRGFHSGSNGYTPYRLFAVERDGRLCTVIVTPRSRRC